MKNTVIIKGNRYGLSIVLDDKAEFSQLIKDLIARLENAESFFDSTKQLAVTFEGRVLTNEELDEILTVIEENSKLNIQYVMEENSDLEATFFDIIRSEESKPSDKMEYRNEQNIQGSELSEESNIADSMDSPLTEMIPLFSATEKDVSSKEKGMLQDDNCGMFYKGTLRSGQSLEAKDSLVIIGDVNPGATVIAGGNIIIIGTLKGSVTAGANGNTQAFVMALYMNPIQIQIADVIARNSDKKSGIKPKEEAMIATIEHGQIVMEPVTKTSLQDINI